MFPRTPSFDQSRSVCPVLGCHQRQQSIQELKEHLVREHNADPVTIYDSPGLYHPMAFIYRCTECGESFQRPQEFGEHFYLPPHVPTGVFRCPHCNDATDQAVRHREHMMYCHFEQRLVRGKPNDAARGELDFHEPRTPDVSAHHDDFSINNFPCGSHFIPMINSRQIVAEIASASNVAIANGMRSNAPRSESGRAVEAELAASRASNVQTMINNLSAEPQDAKGRAEAAAAAASRAS